MAGPSAAAIIADIAAKLKDNLPFVEEKAVAEVHGKPGSKLSELYFLALATVFSLVRRIDAMKWASPPPGMLMLEYSMEEGWVRATLHQRIPLVTTTVANLPRGGVWERVEAAVISTPYTLGTQLFDSAVENGGTQFVVNKPLPLYDRPIFGKIPETVVGEPWGFTGLFIPGIPNSASSANAPPLPFAKRTVLTRSPTCRDPNPNIADPNTADVIGSPNPKPSGDNRSRGSIPIPGGTGSNQALAALVFASLSNPGSADLMTYSQPKSGPLGG